MSAYYELARLVTFRPLSKPISAPGGGYKVSPFSAKWAQTVSLLGKELRAHGARQTVMEIDFRERDLRLDGMPRSDRRAQSPGVVLSFQATNVTGEPHLRYEVATFNDWQDNVRAIALGLERLRSVDRYGVTKRGEQYAGWRQLAASSDAPSFARGLQLVNDHGDVTAALKATHPDLGGSRIDFESVMLVKVG